MGGRGADRNWGCQGEGGGEGTRADTHPNVRLKAAAETRTEGMAEPETEAMKEIIAFMNIIIILTTIIMVVVLVVVVVVTIVTAKE